MTDKIKNIQTPLQVKLFEIVFKKIIIKKNCLYTTSQIEKLNASPVPLK